MEERENRGREIFEVFLSMECVAGGRKEREKTVRVLDFICCSFLFFGGEVVCWPSDCETLLYLNSGPSIWVNRNLAYSSH